MDLKWTTETQTYEATQHSESYNPWDFSREKHQVRGDYLALAYSSMWQRDKPM